MALLASKRCPRCETIKPTDEFYGDASKANGLRSICKDCDKAKGKTYYQQHREHKCSTANARNAAERAAQPPKRCEVCDATIERHRTYCDSCRAEKRRTTRPPGPRPWLVVCSICLHTHAPGRCRISQTTDDLLAMTHADLQRWVSGEDDHIWTDQNWADFLLRMEEPTYA